MPHTSAEETLLSVPLSCGWGASEENLQPRFFAERVAVCTALGVGRAAALPPVSAEETLVSAPFSCAPYESATAVSGRSEQIRLRGPFSCARRVKKKCRSVSCASSGQRGGALEHPTLLSARAATRQPSRAESSTLSIQCERPRAPWASSVLGSMPSHPLHICAHAAVLPTLCGRKSLGAGGTWRV